MAIETIKSVRRIFEILELFDAERRPLPAKEISKRLGYPLMSTHALLKSMHNLGYADFDPPSWSYSPSRSFVTVLDWVPNLLDRERNLLDFVEELNRITKETVNISRRFNTQARIIFGLETMHTVGVSVKVGAMMPLTHSLTGLTLMAAMPDDERAAYLDQLDEQDPVQAKDLNRNLIEEIAQELRQYGTVSRCDIFIQGVGAVCLPVNTLDGREQLIVGVVGPSDRIIKDEAHHRRDLKALVKRYAIDSVFKLK